NGPYHLLLTASSAGETASISEIKASDASVQGVIGFLKGPSDDDPDTNDNSGNLIETAAENAILTVNGIKVTSQSNTIENAIEGVTLNLSKKTTEAAT